MKAPAHFLRARAQQKAQTGVHARLRQHPECICSLPCLICEKPPPSEPAQLMCGADAGAEPYLLPFCGPATVREDCCHNRLHYRRASCCWSGLDPFELALRIWAVSGNRRAGEGIVRRARQAIEQPSGEGNRATWRSAPALPMPEGGS